MGTLILSKIRLTVNLSLSFIDGGVKNQIAKNIPKIPTLEKPFKHSKKDLVNIEITLKAMIKMSLQVSTSIFQGTVYQTLKVW